MRSFKQAGKGLHRFFNAVPHFAIGPAFPDGYGTSMRILILTGSGDPLTSVRPEAEIFIGLRRAGDEVTVMTGRDHTYWESMRQAGIELIDFEPRRRLDLASIRTLRRSLRDLCPDVVYLFNKPAIINTAFAAIGLPPVLVTYRGQTGNIFWYDPSAYLCHLHPRVDAISCVANAVRDDLRRHVRRPERVVTLYKGHDLDWYHDRPADLRPFGIPAGAFVVGCTANHRPRKGVPVLVEAMGLLPAEAPVHLLLIGKGLDDPDLDAQIQASPVAARIHRAGFRLDAPSLTAACSCTVLPAIKREGLPKSVIESMALRVPPIVTDTGGSAELIEEGISGFVVPPNDPHAIARRIEELWRNPAAARAMGEAARERIGSHFNVRATVESTRAFFRQWMEERRTGKPLSETRKNR